jgi:glyoxylase I family protein
MSGDLTRLFNRREVLALLGAGAVAQKAVADSDSGLRFGAIDHVSIAVTDPDRSVAFYSRIFGNTVLRDNHNQRYLKLGPSYVLIAPGQGQEPRHVDQIGAGVEAYQAARVKNLLVKRGIPAKESGQGVLVADLDGIQLQLRASNSWSEVAETATREQAPAQGAIFQPTGLDHLLLRVTDPEKSAVFYSKIFGPVTQRANNRTWFQVGKSRIGLIAADASHRPGVDHFCVSAESFDYESMIKKLQQAGAKVQPPEVAGAPEFHDPDNILVQVMGPRPVTSK